ncbi:MAG: glutamyl-tRNA reductase [Armatimonadetes bacterium]|nr:glutamyl-tRNA reductase [Armatimonadota bacterium]
MHLVVIGLNHTTAPVEIREKLAVPEAECGAFASRVARCEGVREAVALSTCNRTEIYAWTTSERAPSPCPLPQGEGVRDGFPPPLEGGGRGRGYLADDDILDAISDFCGVPSSSFEPYLYSRAGHKAIEHLFRVSSGLDSMVIGEAQVLGQVRNAYAAAAAAGATGPVLNPLFQQAAAVGKRARTETDIGRGAFSVGYTAVQLARSIFDPLNGRTVLIVGAGKMGELAATHLSSAGVTSVLVANRTHSRAEDLAARFEGQAVAFDELPEALRRSDIVITSTGAEEPIVTRAMVSSAMQARRGRPMFLIDVAVPRDVEAGAGDLDNVFLYDIDDLQAVVERHAGERRAEISKVDRIIEEEVGKAMEWFRTLDAVPVIAAMRDKFEEIRKSEVERLRARLPKLSDDEIEAVHQTTRSIVNRICHEPMIRIKEYAAEDDPSGRLETICEVFGICPPEDGGPDA